MPLLERQKLENEASEAFESAIKSCFADKDDFVSDLCDSLSINQRKELTSKQI